MPVAVPRSELQRQYRTWKPLAEVLSSSLTDPARNVDDGDSIELNSMDCLLGEGGGVLDDFRWNPENDYVI
jgi:hypothetical protein